MGSKYLKTSKDPYRPTAMLLYQKKLIEQHYSFLKCIVTKETLVCRGTIESPDFKNKYTIEILCKFGSEPCCKILEPDSIIPSVAIHMYDDRSLCLYYAPDLKWTSHTQIYRFTIPWIVEWVYYYELYLVNGGKWEGPESPYHSNI